MRITETRTFNLTPKIRDAVKISFTNRKGGIDTVQFTRFYSNEIKTTVQTYNSGLTKKAYGVDMTKTLSYHSKWLTEEEFLWLEDLMASAYVRVNDKQVKVEDATYKYDSIERLWAIELSVQSIYTENTIRF
jgi:hypothetical protein